VTGSAPPRRKGKAVRPAPRAIITVGQDDEYEPLRLSSDDTPEVERVVIAYLDDYELTMPKKVPPNIALKVMRVQRKEGEAPAMMQLLESVLGDEGFTKLVDWESLTEDNLMDLFQVVQRVSMGAMETPKSSS
jgi:hypothetical protein